MRMRAAQETEVQRRQAIAWAIALTADTAWAPEPYESDLLECYALGELTIDQVLLQLDNRTPREAAVQHVLYRSRAAHPLTSAQLTDLLEDARAYNQQHQLTGLLCYSSTGHFVQVLEGSAHEVHALYARIRQDARHQEVVTLSDEVGTTRWFGDWQMAYVSVDSQDYFWLIGYLEAHTHHLVTPQIPIADPHLLTLLDKFSQL
jgi:hypothetical protein